MQKYNLIIQLIMAILLLSGINSQATTSTKNFSDIPLVTFNEKTTSTCLEIKPVNKLNSLLPSFDGNFNGTYANYTNGDPAEARYNVGTLTDENSSHSLTFSEIIGPTHGVFIVELFWNSTLAPDIDLLPVWVNSTGDLRAGFPAGVSEIKGDYLSGATPEYYYAEVNITDDEAVTLGAYVFGYENEAIDLYVNATWINYDQYFSSIGYATVPIPEIMHPINGAVYGVSESQSGSQRFVPFNYTYSPGIEVTWMSEIYDFLAQSVVSTRDGGSWILETYINGIEIGQTSVKFPNLYLDPGKYTAEVMCSTFDGVVLTSTSANFTVEGITLGVTTFNMTNSTFTINQEFISPEITAPDQDGTDIASATLFYFDYGTENYWHEVEMIYSGNEIWSYSITDLLNGTDVHYYFKVTDAFGIEFTIREEYNYVKRYVNGLEPTTSSSFVLGSNTIFLLSSFLGTIVIVRRRK